jgi:hypoxanthine-DNA glycosylase
MPDTAFPYSADHDAKVLILGSMPSRKSLAARQYYAHQQNAFWPIMGELFGFSANFGYEQRLERLRENRIALWDVAHQCMRPGSMDHAIDMQSVIANDFGTFFKTHPQIRAIFFNGRKAEELYRRLVQPKLPLAFQQMERHLLPSTSPANARLSRMQKLEAWKIIKDTLEIG